eukprot:6490434-Amphidinium_carterae.1
MAQWVNAACDVEDGVQDWHTLTLCRRCSDTVVKSVKRYQMYDRQRSDLMAITHSLLSLDALLFCCFQRHTHVNLILPWPLYSNEEDVVAEPVAQLSALRCDICRKSPKDCKGNASHRTLGRHLKRNPAEQLSVAIVPFVRNQLVLTVEEAEWSKVNKKTGEAVESRCKLCVTATRAAFPGMTWESILAKAKVNNVFAKQLGAAIKTKAGAVLTCTPEDVTNSFVVGYLVEREFSLYSEKEFSELFGMKPVEAGLALESFKDERGEDLKAVVIDDGGKRRIKLQCMCAVGHNELLHQHEHQLREHQGKDVMDLWTDDLNKCADRPKALRGQKPLTVEAARAQVQAKREKQQAEEAEKARLAEIAAAA